MESRCHLDRLPPEVLELIEAFVVRARIAGALREMNEVYRYFAESEHFAARFVFRAYKERRAFHVVHQWPALARDSGFSYLREPALARIPSLAHYKVTYSLPNTAVNHPFGGDTINFFDSGPSVNIIARRVRSLELELGMMQRVVATAASAS